jgi:hypothetical protein
MRQIYTLKFKSSLLKEFGYKINMEFDEAKKLKCVIALADSQMLRTIREVRGQVIDFDKVEGLYTDREIYDKKLSNSKSLGKDDIEKIVANRNKVQSEIDDMLYVKDYVTIVMESTKDYDYICENGVEINGKVYHRLSCSAGQARKSTIVVCPDDIIDEVIHRLDNDRNKNIPLAASKYNAYFGLSSSATQVVSEPKFIVVKDFENTDTFDVHFVTEIAGNTDDLVEDKTVTQTFNRTDGMGLISPRQAKKWANELGLDYIPSQFGLRQSFIKGMLCTFPIHEFCEEINGGNYIVDTIYKDESGNYIKVDLRDYDIIISESQFKLWNCYNGVDDYLEKCHKNGLKWGIPQYAPKECKNILKMNYQFLQTLNLNETDIKELCKPFVDWITGVSYDNFEYMLLFLLGANNTEESINNFLRSSDNYWLKSLVVNPDLKNDKFIRTKIRDLIKNKIKKGCMGDIYVKGNFQTLVSDPYAYMQHVCGIEPTGLLDKDEFYSNYWNERNVTQVDGMRSPLTFRSEHVVMNLKKNAETEKWYRYCKTGIIINWFGHTVQNFGGADFDLDILATTSDPTIIKGVYRNELTMTYDAPKPEKKIFTKEDIQNADKFGFGSIIGQITNKSSNAYALLKEIEDKYGKDNDMWRITYSRLIQCCKAQSCQIDKTKLGREVKGIPKLWVEYRKTDDKTAEKNSYTPEDIEKIRFYNSILLDKYPYFFRYRYPDCKKKYDKYVDSNETACKQRFGISLKSLIDLSQKTPEQMTFLDNYYKYMPVTMSDSSMNLLCKYIEGINFEISKKIKEESSDKAVLDLKYDIEYDNSDYKKVSGIIDECLLFYRELQFENAEKEKDKRGIFDFSKYTYDIIASVGSVCCAFNYVIDYFYINNPQKSKDVMWELIGRYIYEKLRMNKTTVMFPMPDKNGNVTYLGENYSVQEVEV